MKWVRSKVLWSALAIAAILALTYAWQEYRAPKQLHTVYVSPKWVNQAQFAGLYTAIEKGYFAREGLNVIVREFKSGTALTDLYEGESQFAYASANEILGEYSRGNDIKAVAAYFQVSPYVVVSLREQNITSPRQLKGKVVGIKGGRGAEADAIFSQLLRSAGLDESDVVLNFSSVVSSEKDDLVGGVSDAVGLYRTRLYQFDEEGLQYNAIYPEQYGSAVYNDVLVVTRAYWEENPETVKRFVKALNKGWSYAIKNPDEAIEMTMPYVTHPAYESTVYQRFILDESIPLIQPTRQSKIGGMEADRWERYYNILLDRGVLDKEFDIEELVVFDAVK